MNFISAFSYISNVSDGLEAIGEYRLHRDVAVLATRIGQILNEVTSPYQKSSLDTERLEGALADVIRVFEEAM